MALVRAIRQNPNQSQPLVVFLVSLSIPAGCLHFKVQLSSWFALTQVENDPPNIYLQVSLVDAIVKHDCLDSL